MTDRYDRRAPGYARHWAPVLAPTALRLLDLADAWLPRDGTGATILDVGAGTGTLTLAAARRWPAADVVGLDPSEGMLDVARRAARSLPRPPRFVIAPADAIPLPDASVDVVVSSFVLQLVPDRLAALRDIRRVLRPGGRLAYATWLVDDRPFAAGEAVDAALDDLDVDAPDEPELPRAGDLATTGAAAAQLRRAGFRPSGARAHLLEHAWTAESYLAYRLLCYDEEYVATLPPDQQARLESAARERLAALGPDELRFGADIVFAWGRRPAAADGPTRRAGTRR
jgi:SAM-dependent methyltransferase